MKLLKRRGDNIGSFKGLLLWWSLGIGLVLVLVYTVMLEYYFRFGVILRTKESLERYAAAYAMDFAQNPDAPLPATPNLQSYRSLDAMPAHLRLQFPAPAYPHGQVQKPDFDLDEQRVPDGEVLICDGQPCKFFMLYAHELGNDQWIYLIQDILVTERVYQAKEMSDNIVLVVALGVLLLMGGMAFWLVKRITRPVQELAIWADALTLERLDNAVPDFRIQELNQVAGRLKGAFDRIGQSLEKEHRFLQHASHELRTPIAVASGNLEILDMLAAARTPEEPERKALLRLNYAVREMQQLIETLLWLNRDTESFPPSSPVDLYKLVCHLVESNRYLLAGKSVKVAISGKNIALNAQETLCSIVLANLIRNAFEYTHEGEVSIHLEDGTVCITNANTTGDTEPDSDYGFGLGLDLVRQICERLDWEYVSHPKGSGRCTSIRFELRH